MEHETPQSELKRLREEQRETRQDEVFGGLSSLEREEYDRKTKRIYELQREIEASAAAEKSLQSTRAKQRQQWDKEPETDKPKSEARQPYRSREADSVHSQKSSKVTNRTNPKNRITNEE